MDKQILRTKYEDVLDVINMAQIKVSRVARKNEVRENQEIINCLNGAATWINQLLLTMEE